MDGDGDLVGIDTDDAGLVLEVAVLGLVVAALASVAEGGWDTAVQVGDGFKISERAVHLFRKKCKVFGQR